MVTWAAGGGRRPALPREERPVNDCKVKGGKVNGQGHEDKQGQCSIYIYTNKCALRVTTRGCITQKVDKVEITATWKLKR